MYRSAETGTKATLFILQGTRRRWLKMLINTVCFATCFSKAQVTLQFLQLILLIPFRENTSTKVNQSYHGLPRSKLFPACKGSCQCFPILLTNFFIRLGLSFSGIDSSHAKVPLQMPYCIGSLDLHMLNTLT